MQRLLLLCAVLIVSRADAADSPPPLAEQYLHSGKLADGETASILALELKPADDEVRFGLGVIQFARGIENLGRACYEYGAKSENADVPFLRIPVPENKSPSTISYRALGRILDGFAQDLERAEKSLSLIKDENVKLRLRLADVKFDFTGKGKETTTLVQILDKLNRQRFDFLKGNKEFRVHFDRGDVAWLRAYCHLLSAMVDGYRSVDEEAGFAERVKGIFPKIEETGEKLGDHWLWRGLKVVDPPRLRRARLHLVSVCELNRETWKFILAEQDDDYEWLPNAKQKGVVGLSVDRARIDAWLEMMDLLEGLLKGERLFVYQALSNVFKAPEGTGLNLKKVLDDPPVDLFNFTRLREKGIGQKFLEIAKDKVKDGIGLETILQTLRVFDGPFDFIYAAWFN